ncbi:bifunctional protein-serine/threonine kinase/phosphatase [Psychromonas ossibalaenae]|uniref:bifunctional protein-serine/threonine kinase/phosphatase n=1 Tax=Psychromonas ossibalaenae TaxID=444922 RepID=UPI00037C7C64|nr:bifunctional protein-serine/threonine kinase/phosphatase [Psychromonas ossibalaenae]
MKSNESRKKQHKTELELCFGGYSDPGRRQVNQDAFAVKKPALASEKKYKGFTACIADGVSCSSNAQQASQTSVTQFIADYYSTPQSWSVQKSAGKVLNSLNSWLFQQSRASDLRHNGLITTFSAVIFKAANAYLFHAGDTRIYRYRSGSLTQLTRDHSRTQYGKKDFLIRALGMDCHLDVDVQTVKLQVDDIFLLTSDGIHDTLTERFLQERIASVNNNSSSSASFEQLAENISLQALNNGSKDNLSCLIIAVKHVPLEDAVELYQSLKQLTIPPALHSGNKIDRFIIEKVLHQGARSHIYLASDPSDKKHYVLKMPSLNFADDLIYLDGFSREQWAGIKLKDPRVMNILPRIDNSPFLYHICQFVPGITLRQWIYDNPKPALQETREIIRNIVSAVRVMQRAGLVHRDLKPENIMIAPDNTVTLIDFGTVKIDGLDEISPALSDNLPLGDLNYMAPEYLLQGRADSQSDLFSVAVIAYELLCTELPYKIVNTQSLQQAKKSHWKYQSISRFREDLPVWLDYALHKALQPETSRRYQAMTEFIDDLYRPNPELLKARENVPLIERDPVRFWQLLSAALLLTAFTEFILLLT